MSDRVYVREVGPRDGIQMAAKFLPTENKVAWCRAELEAGVTEIEVTSFVPARVVPQFADADDVARQASAIAGLTASALVPNLKGAINAFASGIPKINFVLSASEEHNLANVRRTVDESLREFRMIVAERSAQNGDTVVAGGIATAFGCTIQGEVSERRVVELAEALVKAGADELIVADTVGYGGPAQVRRLISEVKQAVGSIPIYAHFHDTRGLGLANVTAAVEEGVRHFDASLGGLGGCPFAPGATGNINIEDCVFLMDSLGLDSQIDLAQLIDLRSTVEPWLPDEQFSGMLARAGLPLTYKKTAPSPAG